MIIKLSKGKTLFKFSGVEFDRQDVFIVTLLVVILVGLSLIANVFGLNITYSLIPGILVASIIFRNVLIAKGKIPQK